MEPEEEEEEEEEEEHDTLPLAPQDNVPRTQPGHNALAQDTP